MITFSQTKDEGPSACPTYHTYSYDCNELHDIGYVDDKTLIFCGIS